MKANDIITHLIFNGLLRSPGSRNVGLFLMIFIISQYFQLNAGIVLYSPKLKIIRSIIIINTFFEFYKTGVIIRLPFYKFFR